LAGGGGLGRADKLLGAVATTIVILALFAGLVVVLKQQVIPVREQYQSLKSDYERLEAEYLSLIERYSDLEKSRRRLEEKYRELEKEYASLLEEKAILQRILERYQEAYVMHQLLRESPKVIGSRIRGGEEAQRILRSSPGKEVLEVVSELGLRKDMDPAEKARRVMEWFAVNMEYVPDAYIIAVKNQSVTRIPEHFQTPNETLKRGGGDCEDLAILLYSLLKPVLGEGEELYLIGWATENSGHVAVLYEYNDRYMILDPSSGYSTNAFVAFSIYFKNATITITPAALGPDLKKGLLKAGLAEIVYSPKEEEPYRFLDLNTTVSLWLKHGEGDGETVYVDEIINERINMEFNSTEEFLAWMTGQ